MDFVGTIYSLIPPLVMIILVLLTRKVLISLGVGIIVGALMIESFDAVNTAKTVWLSFQEIFYSGGEWGVWSIQLIAFLLLLGILIAFLTATGGAKAFGNWAINRVKTREGSQYTAGLSGLAIFIDDYFNSLTIGQVSRPITDRHKVSRAKLAYLIDSTSAPVTVLTPISSWGAYIIGTIGGIIATDKLQEQLSGFSAFNTFIGTIPMNYYAIAAIILVFLVIKMRLDFGSMREHEVRAQDTGELIDPLNSDVPGDLQDDVHENNNGRIYHLIIPILVLVVATVTSMIVTGVQATEGEVTAVSIFANTNVNYSLVLGGVLSVLTGMLFYLIQSGEKTNFFRVIWEGIKAMLPAIYILVLAWMIVSIIDGIGTGTYLAEAVKSWNISIAYLPLIIFIISGLMAFATGTSWGTFGMMLPIAGEIAALIDPDFFVASLAAVLAGSVFGDHCSPISDTSVLSSTGAGSNHIDHVLTQIPYALLAALASIFGYLLFALTSSMLVGLLVTIGVLVLLAYLIKSRLPN
ncbi:Na+/H+ antiporter NhaC family protein [Filobacillus milosensis]|uniref:Na+/H+ antiporter NhaC family protein n=1 Tax=Filobacillus milosensis TaxID=94137 RepID=A0A4Y8IVC7_9BACI|nr:Na+/H+ antiporter NhaC family protein [Filobacillus milosensis]TFB24268.1 Na+/H+ antiporter NhaC family protein [Filobacillus milosensis]